MARNYEKNFGRLNRLWFGKVKGKPKRPRLSSLTSAQEIAEWLPSIKDELDFCLKQTEVPCYTDQKVEEYRLRILQLEAEYKSFVRKLRSLDSTIKFTPWTPRPYEKKPRGEKELLQLHPVSETSDAFISELKVSLHDAHYASNTKLSVNEECSMNGCSSDVMDKPLQFILSQTENCANSFTDSSLEGDENVEKPCMDLRNCKKSGDATSSVNAHSASARLQDGSGRKNCLGIYYSSSEEEN